MSSINYANKSKYYVKLLVSLEDGPVETATSQQIETLYHIK